MLYLQNSVSSMSSHSRTARASVTPRQPPRQPASGMELATRLKNARKKVAKLQAIVLLDSELAAFSQPMNVAQKCHITIPMLEMKASPVQ